MLSQAAARIGRGGLPGHLRIGKVEIGSSGQAADQPWVEGAVTSRHFLSSRDRVSSRILWALAFSSCARFRQLVEGIQIIAAAQLRILVPAIPPTYLLWRRM